MYYIYILYPKISYIWWLSFHSSKVSRCHRALPWPWSVPAVVASPPVWRWSNGAVLGGARFGPGWDGGWAGFLGWFSDDFLAFQDFIQASFWDCFFRVIWGVWCHALFLGPKIQDDPSYGDDGLVGGLEPWNLMFPYIGNFIIPTDEVIFFRGVGLNHQPEMVASSFHQKWSQWQSDCFTRVGMNVGLRSVYALLSSPWRQSFDPQHGWVKSYLLEMKYPLLLDINITSTIVKIPYQLYTYIHTYIHTLSNHLILCLVVVCVESRSWETFGPAPALQGSMSLMKVKCGWITARLVTVGAWGSPVMVSYSYEVIIG